ncbi:hypothetical protein DAI22_11g099701 [Oryza sativa Japonica Group]|nr:hypothetical protein DAI22_11g099701 [Oryza sativa Japonica Group]
MGRRQHEHFCKSTACDYLLEDRSRGLFPNLNSLGWSTGGESLVSGFWRLALCYGHQGPKLAADNRGKIAFPS